MGEGEKKEREKESRWFATRFCFSNDFYLCRAVCSLCSVLIKFPERTRGEHHPRALRRRKKNAARGKTGALPSPPLFPPPLRRLLIPVVLWSSKWISRSSCRPLRRTFARANARSAIGSLRLPLAVVSSALKNPPEIVAADDGCSVSRAFPYLVSTVFRQTDATHVETRCLKLARASALLIASNIAVAPSMRSFSLPLPLPLPPPRQGILFLALIAACPLRFQSRMISLSLSLSLS